MNDGTSAQAGVNGYVDIPVMAVSQPLGTFYVGVMSAKDLRRIAAADTRRQRDIETFTGIQRELNERRQKEIRQYISTYDASFPNSFIISVSSEDLLEQTETRLRIRGDEKVASIIDGQHRLAGFTSLNQDNFQLIVAVFVDLPIEDQAMLFATINIKQTKVSPSLVFDLFEETKLRSPQKTCHNVAKALNNEQGSPFYHRIKPLGKKTDYYKGLLTQASFVKNLLPLVCSNPDKVRDDIKRKIPVAPDDPVNRNCIFWRHFAENKDWAILKIVANYFTAVAETFPDDWNEQNDSPLARTIGFQALMRLLPEIYGQGSHRGTLEKGFFAEQLVKARPLTGFTFETYPASGVGENRLYQAIRERVLS
jgi:DGQHR domain-containing protein